MNNKKNEDGNGLLIAGIILCCLGPTIVIGIVLIFLYVTKSIRTDTNIEKVKEIFHPKSQEGKPKEESKIPSKCPSCGANIKKDETKCPYCDTNFE